MVTHLRLAEEFQRSLDSGEAPNRAWLAAQYGLTRARVTQLMSLLLLHPDILAYVRDLPPGTPPRLITEKSLRSIVKLPFSRQLQRAKKHVPGFRMRELDGGRIAS